MTIPVLPMSMATADPVALPPFVPSPVTGPPPLLPGSKLSWPSNMYTIDMAYGFCRMDELLKAKEGNYESRFRQVFNQAPAAESTYYDQVQRWELGGPFQLADERGSLYRRKYVRVSVHQGQKMLASP